MKRYRALAYTYCAESAVVQYPDPSFVRRVTLADPALLVMTDLRVTLPYTIDINASLIATHDKMIACGVRLLFVIDGEGLTRGIMTAQDILGDRPVRVISSRGGARDELTVKDVMTPLALVEVVLMQDVIEASVGNIVESLKLLGRRHLLVIEPEPNGPSTVRGIFSATRIGRQLGEEIMVAEQRPRFPKSVELAGTE